MSLTNGLNTICHIKFKLEWERILVNRKIIFVLILLSIGFITFLLPPRTSLAEGQTVRVTLPSFDVNLNGTKVENQYRKYPLLVYKDITYFPMTWYDSRLLGLETEWTQTEGLKIVKSNVTSSYEPYKTTQKNSNSNMATIPASKITINGKIIDNSKEEYPLLSFNNITYFPLTWKFAHEEFGWGYSWNHSEGLFIVSDNPKVENINLPIYAAKNDIALFNGYYYFTETVGNTNNIYRTKENAESNKELVYSYKIDNSYGFNNQLKFEVRENELWFIYHVGGGVMGYDVFGRVNSNGKGTIEYQGYLDFRNTPYGTLLINYSVPPTVNNLSLENKSQEGKIQKNIGNKNLIYGWYTEKNESGQSLIIDNSTTVIGEKVYVIGSSENNTELYDLNKIYRINLSTNETSRIIDSEVKNFKISNNKIYYVKEQDHFLYSSNIDGTNEQRASDNKVANWYGLIGENIFYTVENNKGQINLFRENKSTEDELILDKNIERIYLTNDKLICNIHDGDYGVIVINKTGSIYLAITDKATDIFVDNNSILMKSDKDKSIKMVDID